MLSLGVEIAQSSAQYLKYLSDAQGDGDDGERVHGTEEDGLFKVFRNHAFGHIEGLFQRTGIAHEQRMDLGRRTKRQVRQTKNDFIEKKMCMNVC